MKWLLVAAAAVVLALVAAFLLLGRHEGIVSGRYGRMARVGRLYGRLATGRVGAWLRKLFASHDARERIDAARRAEAAAAVAHTMGHMKGAFMKLGQMLSFVSDEIPQEMQNALKSLQTQAPPMDLALLRDVAERELGKPLERAFARFDKQPLAAASIGQVHRAMLPDGREVVVKIQYPGVADTIAADMANVAVLYRMVSVMYPSMEPGPIVSELRERFTEELDYRIEARNQKAFFDLYRGHPFIKVPEPIEGYCTQHVLTSEYCPGRSFDEAMAEDEASRSRHGEMLYRFVFGSIFGHGMFNGDPHPGNYLFNPDHIVFLDFGCVKYFEPTMLENWRSLVLTHIAGDRPEFRRRAVALGFLKEDAPVPAEQLYDFFAYFYEPIDGDRPFTFTRKWNVRSFRMILRPDGAFQGMEKKMNMPRDFVFVNRIQWGVYSILARLEATANWHRIHEELLAGAQPATELGRQAAAWRARYLGAGAGAGGDDASALLTAWSGER